MYELLFKLMLISAFIDFGITATDLLKVGSKMLGATNCLPVILTEFEF